MKRFDFGVSAVIGVILMVAITVAIAATVYVYVSNMIDVDVDDFTGEKTGFFSGIVVDGQYHYIFIVNNESFHWSVGGCSFDYYPLYGQNCTFFVKDGRIDYVLVNP